MSSLSQRFLRNLDACLASRSIFQLEEASLKDRFRVARGREISPAMTFCHVFAGSAVPQQREGKEHGGRADAVASHGEEARHLAVQRRPVPFAAAPGHVEENEFGFGAPSERQRSVPIDHHHPPSARYASLLFSSTVTRNLLRNENSFSKEKDGRGGRKSARIGSIEPDCG